MTKKLYKVDTVNKKKKEKYEYIFYSNAYLYKKYFELPSLSLLKNLVASEYVDIPQICTIHYI